MPFGEAKAFLILRRGKGRGSSSVCVHERGFLFLGEGGRFLALVLPTCYSKSLGKGRVRSRRREAGAGSHDNVGGVFAKPREVVCGLVAVCLDGNT